MGIKGIFQGDIIKISILFFLVSSFFMLILKDVRKLFTKSKKKAIIYAVVVLIVFALTALLSSSKVLNNTILNSFIGFQVLFLIFGSLHVFVLRTFFKDLSKDKSNFFNEFFFTLGYVFIGLIVFFKITNNFKPLYSFAFLSSVLTFVLPLLFYKLFEFSLLIPIKIYKKWLYPTEENIKEPTLEELRNPLVISFEFKKKGDDDDEVTNFRVKAPEHLNFGKLFYFFLNDYNERHPEEKIKCFSEDESPYEWAFYRRPSLLRAIKYLDYSKTVNLNNLKEDDVIICERV